MQHIILEIVLLAHLKKKEGVGSSDAGAVWWESEGTDIWGVQSLGAGHTLAIQFQVCCCSGCLFGE